jgi:hypothetical protein
MSAEEEEIPLEPEFKPDEEEKQVSLNYSISNFNRSTSRD